MYFGIIWRINVCLIPGKSICFLRIHKKCVHNKTKPLSCFVYTVFFCLLGLLCNDTSKEFTSNSSRSAQYPDVLPTFFCFLWSLKPATVSWSKGYMCAGSCPNVTAGTSEYMQSAHAVETWTTQMFRQPASILNTLFCINRLPQSTEWFPALWGQRAGSHCLELSSSAAVNGPEPGGLCHTLLTVSGLQVFNLWLFSYCRLEASGGFQQGYN